MIENYLRRSLYSLKNIEVGVLQTPFYFPQPLSSQEANSIPWEELTGCIKPIVIVSLASSDTQALLIQKYKTWSCKDLCIIVGSQSKDLSLLQDLDLDDGESFLDLNFQLARRLVSGKDRVIHVAYGFNPEDSIAGTHSLKRLHSHIYVAESDFLKEETERRIFDLDYKNLNWFEKLSLIEPFAQVYYDFIVWKLQRGSFGSFLYSPPRLRLNTGYISFDLKDSPCFKSIFSDLKELFGEMQREYQAIEGIFTDKEVSASTNRYLLLPVEERRNRWRCYLDKSGNWLSSSSTSLISGLVEKIVEAEPRKEECQIDKVGNLWITKGFAGGINFAFFNGEDRVRFDFIPRVISTSNMLKILHGENRPCFLERSDRLPTDSELGEMRDYLEKVVTICRSLS